MKKLFTIFLLMLGVVNVFGQDANQNEKTILGIYCGPTKTDPTKSPMLVVNGKYIIYPLEDMVSRFRVDDIEDLNVYKIEIV